MSGDMRLFVWKCSSVAAVVVAFVSLGTAILLASNQRSSSRDGCERAVLTRTELAGFLQDAADARRDAGDDGVADKYERREARIRKAIVDCAAAYPSFP